MLYLLADTANPAFGPGDEMMESGKLLAASRAQVDAYTAAVLRQGEIKLDKIQNLERYQMEAREHAQSWQADVSTGLIAANTELISFANTFDSYYAPLYSLAGGITTGNNRAEFISGLETLVRQVRRQQDHTAQASKKLTSFTRNIHNDYGNFQDLVQQARSVYEGDKGELARLEELAKTLTDGMKKD
ncbi:HBL/NHE enterotoxin family protein, partial [Streptomyces noursei]|uniref:HBL/NHE enterotoxin family protein n=3 Tax=Streptomyces TaxID=1883 RepID=UPI0035D9A6B4